MKKILDTFLNNKYLFVLTIIVLITSGLIIRIAFLNTDFWYDEAFSAIVARLEWSELFRVIAADRVHPPTFYMLLKLWSGLFGTSVNAIRSFSMLWGILLIPMSLLFINSITKDKVMRVVSGLSVVILFAFSPFFIAYSLEARVYTFLAFWGVVALYVFFKAVNEKRVIYWILLVLTLGLLVASHYLSVIYIPGFILGYLIFYFYQKNGFGMKNFWFIFWIIFFIIVVAGLYFIDTYIMDRLNIQSNWWIPIADFNTILRSFTGFIFGVDRQAQGIPPFFNWNGIISTYFVSSVFMLLSLTQAVRLWYLDQSQRDNLILLSSITFVPFTLFVLTSVLGVNIFVDRYLIIGGTFLLIWLVFVWTQTIGSKFLIILSIFIFSTVFLVYPAKVERYSKIAETIKILQKVKEYKLVFHDPMDFVMMKYYLPEYRKYVIAPTEYPDYSGWALINSGEINNEVLQNPHICLDYYKSEDCLYIVPGNIEINGTSSLKRFLTTPDYIIYKPLVFRH